MRLSSIRKLIFVAAFLGLGSGSYGQSAPPKDFLSWPEESQLIYLRTVSEQEARAAFRLLNTDALTGLKSRRAFDQMVDREKDALFTAVFIDLNNFKMINDTFGHEVGDEVLKQVGEALFSTVRESSFRYGGDEFVILLKDIKEPLDILPIIARIEEKVEEYQHSEFHISLSFGVAVATGAEESIESLKKRSDAAMYKAKDRKSEGARFPVYFAQPAMGSCDRSF